MAQIAREAPLLEVDGVTLRFGRVTALEGVTFQVAEGATTALIGPNGAGKTSMFNCMSGTYRPTEGSIRLGGVDVGRLPQHRIARLGIARTFQTPSLFNGMTVLENIVAGRYLHGKSGTIAGILRLPSVIREEVAQRARAEEILELLEIQEHRHASVEDLSYGLQKRVEFGRALAQEPRLLLLDEPMAGMTIEEKQEMVAFIRVAKAELGTTILLVEHDIGVALGFSDRVVVLDFGRKIGDGTPDEVRRNSRVIEAYLGDAGEAPVTVMSGGAA